MPITKEGGYEMPDQEFQTLLHRVATAAPSMREGESSMDTIKRMDAIFQVMKEEALVAEQDTGMFSLTARGKAYYTQAEATKAILLLGPVAGHC